MLSLSRKSLIDYAILAQRDYTPNWHHELIAKKLEDVERGRCKRLMIFMPPRHGKSELASIKFPAWYLGRNPEKEVVCCSHTAELAEEFGRRTRLTVEDEIHKAIFPDCKLIKGSKKVSDWKIGVKGGFMSVGVRGSLTGRGADLLIIDDPVKDRADAESTTLRRQTWEWYTSTARTRVQAGGAVIVIMCMTGDTKVLMADGTEKNLCNIKVGDNVMTYEYGMMMTSTVKNWKSNGEDDIFKVTTGTGKVVRANERHPFLTYHNNKLKWTRLRDLSMDHKIVTLKDSGVSGKEKPVPNVISQLSAEGTAPHTTTKRGGLMGTVHHLLMKSHGVMRDLSIGMESLMRNTISFLKNKEGSVQFASNPHTIMSGHTGEESFALTTATTQGKLEDYYATTATLQWDMQETEEQLWISPNTFDFTLEDIVSIEEDGVEEVFDIQVDRTENFIANGVVSHNTRWHDDDLAGRILQVEGEKKHYWNAEKGKWEKIAPGKIGPKTGKWDVLRLPAVAIEKEEYRNPGDPLWEDKYDTEALEDIKQSVGIRDWGALFQQDPVLDEGAEFQKDWFKYWKQIPDFVKYVTTVDLAISKRDTADDSVVMTVAIDVHDNIYVVEYKNWKATPSEVIDEIYKRHEKYKGSIGVESVGYQQSLMHYLQLEGRKRGQYLHVEAIRTRGNKEEKIRGLQPYYANGMVYHPPGGCDELEDQLKRFPNAKHDDVIDALSMCLGMIRRPSARNLSNKPMYQTVGLKYNSDGTPSLQG